MKFEKFIIKLQNTFRVTKTELLAVSVILFGLLAGLGIKFIFAEPPLVVQNETTKNIYDSLLVYQENELQKARRQIINESKAKNNLPAPSAKNVVMENNSKNKYQKKQMPSSKINIRTASKVQLMKLPRVGEKTAEKIINYRDTYGFTNLEDIMNVKGIGSKTFENMKPYIELK